ncbi:MAG TPA: 5'-methylthioadenosine/S-adenosylhomocysteine nucleosidase [Buttiauxella sp.]|uniref:5'-methylthioadenosine/S-adenosylhomocysteine nucleosidase n=1 Tax=Buttiauxella sp. TaxID=1972222 RepID=UPI002B47C8DC|nr:5'-methylthioadenosine/S-adenosylhomocysteine nucleosidase [Buttiauxella sp.]HKM98609.1 5'-methylthioadenosine/S-adenosylhomocysteine nucleosidase [Buttiauxella sp.]
MRKHINKLNSLVMSGLMAACVAGWTSSTALAATNETSEARPILIQGPMPIEAEKFANKLNNVKTEKSGSFVFYIGTIDNYPVIVSKTGKGIENTAANTAVAILKYNPIAIINQGTSGGHDPSLNVGDIVLGKRTTNTGSLKTGDLDKNQGSNPMTWSPMDLMASEGSGSDPNAKKIRYYEGDKDLIASANAVKNKYTKGKVVEGTIASSDVWNDEVDRIHWFNTNFGTSVEEMEGAAGAQIANAYGVKFLGIRVLSNNKSNGGKYNPETAAGNQDYVYEVVKYYISTLKGK